MIDAFDTAGTALREAAAALEAGARANKRPTPLGADERRGLAYYVVETLDALLLLLGTVDVHPHLRTTRKEDLEDAAGHIFTAAERADAAAQGFKPNQPTVTGLDPRARPAV